MDKGQGLDLYRLLVCLIGLLTCFCCLTSIPFLSCLLIVFRHPFFFLVLHLRWQLSILQSPCLALCINTGLVTLSVSLNLFLMLSSTMSLKKNINLLCQSEGHPVFFFYINIINIHE